MPLIDSDPDPEKLSRLLLIPIDPKTGEPLTDQFPPRRVPYFPESVSYSRGDIGWEEEDIPGLSHGLLSWTSNGNATLSFEVKLATELDPRFIPEGFFEGQEDISLPIDKEKRIDIDAATAWFTGLSNPLYPEEDGKPVQSPPVVQIVSEAISSTSQNQSIEQAAKDVVDSLTGGNDGSEGTSINEKIKKIRENNDSRKLNEVGTNFSQIQERDFYGVLDSLEIEYEKFFASGNPKIANISLTFKETIQIGEAVKPHNRSSNLSVAESFKLFD